MSSRDSYTSNVDRVKVVMRRLDESSIDMIHYMQ